MTGNLCVSLSQILCKPIREFVFYAVTSPNVVCSDRIPVRPWCSHTYIYSCPLRIGLPKLHVSAKCENGAKERLWAVLSGDNIITPTVSLCLIEIFSEFQGQTGGNSYLCRWVYRSHGYRYSGSSGCLAGPGTEGVIMIRIISFRGTAAKVVITCSSITGGIRIPFYSSLLQQSIPKINRTFF